MVADAPTGGQTGNHDEMVGCRSSIRSSTKVVLEEHLKIFSRLSSCLCLPVGSKLKRKKNQLDCGCKMPLSSLFARERGRHTIS